MTVTPIVASYVPQYAARESYITSSEYLAAPTGTDTSQLLPGAGREANIMALAGVIQRASSFADDICRQVLAATVDVQVSPPEGWRVQQLSFGQVIRVPCDNTPIIQVNGVSLGWDPSSVAAWTDLTGVWITRKVVTIPAGGVLVAPTGAAPTFVGGMGCGGRVWGSVTYVNGWFNASTATSAAVGATEITPTDVLGVYPGLAITFYDALAARQEAAVVSPTYVVGTSPVTLTGPLRYAHDAWTAVSAMPPVIRQAVISLTSSLIKRRGGEAMVIHSINQQPDRKTLGEDGMSADEKLARDLLKPFTRVR